MKMNLIAALRQYVNKMIEGTGPGMKVLLLDQDTTNVIGLIYTLSEIMQQEVFLCDLISNPRESIRHLKCICYLRPTRENVTAVCRELKNPQYASYNIYFSHTLSKQDLKSLAEADEHELVREVHEFYADYLALAPFLFTVDQPLAIHNRSWRSDALNRSLDALTSVCLSLKKCPLIRYQNSSDSCRRLAEQIRSFISREASLFDFRQPEVPPLLLILDRKEDPITPLLNQWTYEAMVHEVIGIRHNRVDLSRVPGVSPELQEITLSVDHDEFYRNNRFANFGDIGQAIKVLMDEFQKKSADHGTTTGNVQSIEDMQNFLLHYPTFKRFAGNVSKHVTLVSELSRAVGEFRLLDVSECEQQLACFADHSAVLASVQGLLASRSVRDIDALRLVLLYALRYETYSGNELTGLMDALSRRNSISEKMMRRVYALLEYGGARNRSTDLFGTKTPQGTIKRFLKGLKGVENIYTQHRPVLADILDGLAKGRLKESSFPFVSGTGGASASTQAQDVIVFIIGGTTYEEALTVHLVNRNTPKFNVVLGGTTVHNCRSFLEEVDSAMEGVGQASFARAQRPIRR